MVEKQNHRLAKAAAQQEHPVPDGHPNWRAYWSARGTSWRTEPEINQERARFLTERRAVMSDIARGVYPFKDVPLSRADIEWLLATHESGGAFGPVEWSDQQQRERATSDSTR